MPRQQNPVAAAFAAERAKRAQHSAPDGTVGTPPAQPGPRWRLLKQETNMVQVGRPTCTIDEARAMIAAETDSWRQADNPYLLVVAAPPGVGKTTRAVNVAEACASAGLRVLFLGPRLDFFDDLMQIATRPTWWYQWKSREHRDANSNHDMCWHAGNIAKWMQRGYDAMAFCSNPRICGWDVVNGSCPFHAQKREVAQPIVFGQHPHLTLGHPLMKTFDVIIGDENPISAFKRHWYFEPKYIVPGDMDLADPATELLHELRRLVRDEEKLEGPELLERLGGATYVREVCDEHLIPLNAKAETPNLRRADDVDEAPYFHLPHLLSLLRREATEAEQGKEYAPRVAVSKGLLHLLLRYKVNPQATEKIMWLDGTANQQVYEAMFERPVALVAPQVALKGKVFQVWPRTNGKSSLMDQEGKRTEKASQLQQQVDHIVTTHGYKNPVVVTFEGLKELFSSYQTGHFYGLRGTNTFEQCDAVIIAGGPSPSRPEIHTQARMLFDQRMEPFNLEWSDRDVVYAAPRDTEGDGTGYSYPVAGFWHDQDLNALLWQNREAEIIQVAHRGRPTFRDVDVWLLTNIPIEQLPPTKVMSIAELFDAPNVVDPYRWPEVMRIAQERLDAVGCVTSADFVKALKCSPTTAGKYVNLLISECGWERIEAATKGRGQPPKAATRP